MNLPLWPKGWNGKDLWHKIQYIIGLAIRPAGGSTQWHCSLLTKSTNSPKTNNNVSCSLTMGDQQGLSKNPPGHIWNYAHAHSESYYSMLKRKCHKISRDSASFQCFASRVNWCQLPRHPVIFVFTSNVNSPVFAGLGTSQTLNPW